MSQLLNPRLELPPKLVPVFAAQDKDVRAAWGGRGSAKTRTFAKMTAVRAVMWAQSGSEGIILCGRQYMNSLEDSSLEEIKAAIKSEPWLAERFDVGEKYVRTLDKRISYTFSGLDRNIDSVKSKARILLCWIDEAEPVTDDAWNTLIPTIREEGSELWVTWNPKRKNAPVEKRFRYSNDPRTIGVEINWRDNPWFPDKLDRTRLKDQEERPDSYDHIWEGGYLTAVEGAYFVKQLAAVKAEGRVCRLAPDDLMTIRLFADIGGTGARADAFTMWAAQFVAKEIRVLKYYEVIGQPIGAHLTWLRENKYTSDRAQIWLPHDGSTQDKVYDVSYESAFTKAGYSVTVVPNQGKGAAKMRIEALRRVFPYCWFDDEGTADGRDALAWYHEKWDPIRDTGLGPEHDWASHGSDAAGLMAVCYEEPKAKATGSGFKRRGSPMAV